jgi:FKBP-type peptidyl-prolyl cis-trans isomerase
MQKMYLILMIAALAVAAFWLSGCSKEKQKEKDEEAIQAYLAENNLSADYLRTTEGIYYRITQTGIGENPGSSANVTVHYAGRLLDGTQFDSSYERGTPATFSLTGVIEGWRLCVPLLNVGARGSFIIPSHLAYARNPPSGSIIPSNAVLIFDIELISIN